MSAVDTTLRVLEWAVGLGGNAPPRGDLGSVDELTKPQPQLNEALGRLLRVTSARLRLSAPALGDKRAAGSDSLLMAAAVAVSAAPDASSALLSLMRESAAPAEWVLRHGLSAPALPYLPEWLADEFRRSSPLTAVLERPILGGEVGVLDDAFQALASHPEGRRLVVQEFAKASVPPAVRDWRTGLLDRLRLQNAAGRAFVLDVYEAAIVEGEALLLRQIAEANRVLMDLTAPQASIAAAMSFANWWGPLSALSRTHGDELRFRPYLGYSHREGIKLYKLAARFRGRP